MTDNEILGPSEEKPLIEAETPTQPDGLIGAPVAPLQPVKPRNQHLKAENPKNKQFTGRSTEAEFEKINKAIAARKKQLGLAENSNYDIVRLALDLLKHIENDFLSSFKTK
ncbi:hypothetical protein [Pedobacter cryophilus]|uniref:Uncharacterized protein n=1 Tax=Pedobacter cryophilus TaxID=2571271 RepID=A0A4U1BYV4_9SPHI|nr:hypothetical protein [Pedobacter cryophilus]TKB96863.1 hypothetical protein FA046_12355 [Pedobacter cryophilus]